MAGKEQLAITERQLAVLELLWDHGPLTVREVLARLPGGKDLPYTTVLGLLQRMEKAGLVAHGGEQPAGHVGSGECRLPHLPGAIPPAQRCPSRRRSR